MEENHILALYPAYYLSRFDKEGLKNLGYKNWKESFRDISLKLKVKEHSVRNWRDEFDPLHGFRKGWYQRPLSPSRIRIVKALENLEEKAIRSIVIDILKPKDEMSADLEILKSISDENELVQDYEFVPRGITGKKAENYFLENYTTWGEFIEGILVDTRDLGVGYDFRIEGDKFIYIEVKGLVGISGGVLLTDKEWNVANEYKDDYFLVVISNLNKETEVKIINNPANKLIPKKNITTSIVVNWNVSSTQISEL